MEFSVGLMTDQLAFYSNAFRGASVPTFTGSWTDPGSGKKYYSLLVRAPSSAIVIELLGASLEGDDLALASAVEMPAPRLTAEDIAALEATHARGVAARRRAEEGPAPKPTQPLLSPVKISWLTSDVARDVAFFTGVLGAAQAGSLNATDGSQTVAIKLAASDPRTIYVTQSAARSSAGLQIAEWEQTMNALHAKEMPTDNYGFDRYCDFHLGHAHVAGTLDLVITKLKSYSGKYRFFVPPNGD